VSAPGQVDGTSLHPGVMTPPLSKADAQRALVLAQVLGWPEWPEWSDEELPDDVGVMCRGLATLAQGGGALDCRDGGTALRLLLGQAAVTPGAFTFSGSARLGERPLGALIRSLNEGLGAQGLRIDARGWPIRVESTGKTGEPRFRLDASASSQFATSLLLVSARLAVRERRAWSVVLQGAGGSGGYVDLTVEWLRRGGFQVDVEGPSFRVQWQRRPTQPALVPRDWSSASYLLLLAWCSGGEVAGLDPNALHPDRALVDLLESVGLTVAWSDAAVRVSGTPLRGVDASIRGCPDLALTLAALACVLPAPSRLRDVAVLRDKESDRVEAALALAQAAGVEAHLEGDSLRIDGPARSRGTGVVDARGDHRVAMSAGVLAALTRGVVRLTDTACVSKSFPGFWREAGRVGLKVVYE